MFPVPSTHPWLAPVINRMAWYAPIRCPKIGQSSPNFNAQRLILTDIFVIVASICLVIGWSVCWPWGALTPFWCLSLPHKFLPNWPQFLQAKDSFSNTRSSVALHCTTLKIVELLMYRWCKFRDFIRHCWSHLTMHQIISLLVSYQAVIGVRVRDKLGLRLGTGIENNLLLYPIALVEERYMDSHLIAWETAYSYTMAPLLSLCTFKMLLTICTVTVVLLSVMSVCLSANMIQTIRDITKFSGHRPMIDRVDT